MESRPLADGKTIRLFAIGQLGWAILSGIISNWLVYYYMPSDTLVAEGMPIFITQGIVCAGLTKSRRKAPGLNHGDIRRVRQSRIV